MYQHVCCLTCISYTDVSNLGTPQLKVVPAPNGGCQKALSDKLLKGGQQFLKRLYMSEKFRLYFLL